MKNTNRLCAAILVVGASVSRSLWAQEQDLDNGTNPTRMSTQASLNYEYTALRNDFTNRTAEAIFQTPVGGKSDYALRLRVPYVATNLVGNSQFGMGDIGVKLSHVFGVDREGGSVVSGEYVFDSAHRPELGAGRDVFKGTFIYARFLPGGAIFAPAIVHSASVAGNSSRARVSTTTVDFYYVPKLSNPKMLITLDPSINKDWAKDEEYLSLSVTWGYLTGRALGGNGQIYLKPTALAGRARPADWGVEIGYKLIGF